MDKCIEKKLKIRIYKYARKQANVGWHDKSREIKSQGVEEKQYEGRNKEEDIIDEKYFQIRMYK